MRPGDRVCPRGLIESAASSPEWSTRPALRTGFVVPLWRALRAALGQARPIAYPRSSRKPPIPSGRTRVVHSAAMSVDEAAVAALRSVLAAKPGAVVREGQERMARAVAMAIDQRHHLLAEAGTGTGKSLAYLVPCVGLRRANGDRHRHQEPPEPTRRTRASVPGETSRCALLVLGDQGPPVVRVHGEAGGAFRT